MVKTNKISNLKRLNFKNKIIVLLYLLKSAFKIKPSLKEHDVYIYYNCLINSNGFYLSETSKYYLSEFKNNFSKIIKLRKYPSSDMAVFQQIYGWREYQLVVDNYKKYFKYCPDYHLNIIDAGSNIGLTALFFLEYFNKPNIISVEPEIENFKILDFNLNSEYSKIIKINGAVWHSNSKIKIVKDFRDKLDWSFRVEETNSVEGIQAYTINQLAKDNNFEFIDILKVDIEGSEKQIFNPKLSNLDFLNITKCVAIEIHDEFKCREDIYKLLKDFNFEYYDHAQTTIGINRNFK